MYVNGEYRGEDELGKLMHDFNCTNADDMNYDLLAERTRYLKENPEGVSIMCKAMEDMRDNARAEGRAEGELMRARETAINLYNMGMAEDFIAKAVNVSIELVKQWLGQTKA